MKKVTIHNLDSSTAQEVFDFIANHLFKQGEKAINIHNNLCKYRVLKGKKVLKCAAGSLIPKKDYDESFEGKGWVQIMNHSGFSGKHSALIRHLQSLHDSYNADTWLYHLKRAAEDDNLKWNFNNENVHIG